MAIVKQYEITLPEYPRGFHLIDRHILEAAGALPESGLMHIFILHTSAGICINENADPSVRRDFETVFDRLAPESDPAYVHNTEGPDDMPAHIKSVLAGASVSIPVHGGRLHLGTWQGIYLCEFRNHGGQRKLLVTLIS